MTTARRIKIIMANPNNLSKLGISGVSQNTKGSNNSSKRVPLRSLSTERNRKKMQKKMGSGNSQHSPQAELLRCQMIENINSLYEQYQQLQLKRSLFSQKDPSLVMKRQADLMKKCVPKSKINLINGLENNSIILGNHNKRQKENRSAISHRSNSSLSSNLKIIQIGHNSSKRLLPCSVATANKPLRKKKGINVYSNSKVFLGARKDQSAKYENTESNEMRRSKNSYLLRRSECESISVMGNSSYDV